MEERADNPAVERPSRDRDGRWGEIADSPEFASLQSLQRRVTIGALGIFAAAFGTFLVLCGYDRPLMRKSVDGGLTVAYVWLLALTVLTWVLVWAYLSIADGRLRTLAQRAIERGSRTETAP